MTTGVELIVAERQRQIDGVRRSPESDDQLADGQLAIAAACYVLTNLDCYVAEPLFGEDAWPWGPKWDQRRQHNQVRRLAIAGALIAAELDRLLRGDQLIRTVRDPKTGEWDVQPVGSEGDLGSGDQRSGSPKVSL